MKLPLRCSGIFALKDFILFFFWGGDPAKDTGAEKELLGAWGRVMTPRNLWVLSSSHFWPITPWAPLLGRSEGWGRRTSFSGSFSFSLFFLFVVNFVIHWNEMWNQPWVYMCYPSRSPLPSHSPPAPPSFSQCTRSERLSHASNLGWWSVSP